MSSMDDPVDPRESAETPRSGERRRLLQGGLAAGPVLMTVLSRPVLGQVACTPSAATSINLRTSLTHNCFIPSGLSPEQWKAKVPNWPSPYQVSGSSGSVSTSGIQQQPTSSTGTILDQLRLRASQRGTTGTTTTAGTATSTASTPTIFSGTGTATGNTPFHSATTGLNGRVFGDRTMLEVIDIGEGQSTMRGLGRYVVAALLNARAGRTRMLTETTARNIWNDLVNRGYYEATAGVRWDVPKVIAYIKTTIV